MSGAHEHVLKLLLLSDDKEYLFALCAHLNQSGIAASVTGDEGHIQQDTEPAAMGLWLSNEAQCESARNQLRRFDELHAVQRIALTDFEPSRRSRRLPSPITMFIVIISIAYLIAKLS